MLIGRTATTTVIFQCNIYLLSSNRNILLAPQLHNNPRSSSFSSFMDTADAFVKLRNNTRGFQDQVRSVRSWIPLKLSEGKDAFNDEGSSIESVEIEKRLMREKTF